MKHFAEKLRYLWFELVSCHSDLGLNSILMDTRVNSELLSGLDSL